MHTSTVDAVWSTEHAVLLLVLSKLGLCAEFLPLILVFLEFLLGLDLLGLGRLYFTILLGCLLRFRIYCRAR